MKRTIICLSLTFFAAINVTFADNEVNLAELKLNTNEMMHGEEQNVNRVSYSGFMEISDYEDFVNHFPEGALAIIDRINPGQPGGNHTTPPRAASVTRNVIVKGDDGIESIKLSLTLAGAGKNYEIIANHKSFKGSYFKLNLSVTAQTIKTHFGTTRVHFNESLSKLLHSSFVIATGLRSRGYIDHEITCSNGLCQGKFKRHYWSQ